MKYRLIIMLLVWCASLLGKPLSESEWQEEKKDFVYTKKKEEKEAPKKHSDDGDSGTSKTRKPSAFPNFTFPTLSMSVLYGFVFLVVLGILVLLLKNVTLPQKMQAVDPDMESAVVEERLMETDIDRLIRMALETSNYQLATRYTFLKTLKTLVNKNKLVWKKQYTNKDYVSQLYQSPCFKDFQKITKIYERKWYRNDPASREEYEAYSVQCHQIYSSL